MPALSMGSAGISRKRVLVCCACYVVVFIRKRLFLSLWAFCLRRIFAAFNEVYARYFTSKPARSCVAVKDLPKGALCEIEAVAELD